MHYLSKIQHDSDFVIELILFISDITMALVVDLFILSFCRAIMNLQGWIVYGFFACIVEFQFFTGVLIKLDDVE